MSTSAELLAQVEKVLKIPGATDAGPRVFSPGDWPVWDQQYPVIKLRVSSEEKTSLGRGSIEFEVVTTVEMLVQVAAAADAADGGAGVAEEALWKLQRQVEVAVINSYPLTFDLQQYPFVRSQSVFSADGEKHLGAMRIQLGLEHYQGPEDFAPIQATDVLLVDIAEVNLPPAGVEIDTSS